MVARFGWDGSNIVCNMCASNPPWCEHVEDLVKNSLDTHFIWASGPKAWWEKRLSIIAIPIFPTSNMWQRVEMERVDIDSWPENSEPVEPKFAMLNLFFHEIDPMKRGDFVGTISPGEGRKVIRALLFEKMLADPEVRTAECECSMHNTAAQHLYEKHCRDGLKMLEQWSIWKSGVCNYCSIHFTFGPGLLDDLVPANERNNSF